MAITNELVTEYSVTLKDQTLTVLNNLQTSFEKINDLATDFGRILTGGQDFTSFFKQFVSGATDIRNMAKATGISTKAIQEWSYAAKASGVSADSILSDMKSLKAQYAIGEKDLIRLSKTFSKSSAFYSQQLGSYLGMSQDMITLLRQGPAEVKKLLDEAHKMNAVLSEEQINKAATAQEEFNKAMAAFTGTLQQVMAENVLPKITTFFEKLNKYLGKHPDLMLEKVGTAFKIIVGIKITSWLIKAGSEFGKFAKILDNTQLASIKMSTSFSKAVEEMSKKEKGLGVLGKTLNGLGTGVSKLTGLIKNLTMAWTAFEIGQGLGKLLGLDDENSFLGKWFAEAGADAGDLLYDLFKSKKGDISDLSEEELNKRRKAAGLPYQPVEIFEEEEENDNDTYQNEKEEDVLEKIKGLDKVYSKDNEYPQEEDYVEPEMIEIPPEIIEENKPVEFPEELNNFEPMQLSIPEDFLNLASPQQTQTFENNKSFFNNTYNNDNSSNDTQNSTVINNFNIWNVSGGNGMNLLGYPNNT